MSLSELLAHSIESGDFIRVHVGPEGEALEIDGRVLALSDELVLLATVQNGYRPNGVAWLRVGDLGAIDLPSPRNETASRVLSLRGERLETAEGLVASSFAEAFATAAKRFRLVTFYVEGSDEDSDPEECFVGIPLSFDEDSVEVQLLDPDARPDGEPERFDFEQITRLEAGGEYEQALELVHRARGE